jgi:hypothetical protein
MMFLCYWWAHEQQRNNEVIEATRFRRCWLPFCAHRSAEGKWCCNQRIPHVLLPMPWDLPWKMIYGSPNDQAIITLTRFDSASYNRLHGHFCQFFKWFTPNVATNDGKLAIFQRRIGGDHVSRGQKRIITSEAFLGLLLVFKRYTIQNLCWADCLDYLILQLVFIYTLQGWWLFVCWGTTRLLKLHCQLTRR